MKNISTLLMLFLAIPIFAQKDWKKHSGDNYEISYPKEWRLDTSGQMNSSFILFSEGKEIDSFSENINMLIQDVLAYRIDLDKYFEISKEQILSSPEGKIIDSHKKNSNQGDYYETIWEANLGQGLLKFKQHYYVKKGKAYVLTLTALPDTFINYEAIADEILKSFKLK